MQNPSLDFLRQLTDEQRADLAAGELRRMSQEVCKRWYCRVATVVQFRNGDIMEPFGQNVFTAEPLPEPVKPACIQINGDVIHGGFPATCDTVASNVNGIPVEHSRGHQVGNGPADGSDPLPQKPACIQVNDDVIHGGVPATCHRDVQPEGQP